MSASRLNADETPAQVDLAAAWRETVEAGLRYWGRLGRLTFDAVSVFVPLVAEVRPGVPNPAESVPEESPERTILVEAEAGQAGLGVFLVENTTPRQLSIPLSLSPFVGEDGREGQPTVTFRPDVVTLDSGEQLVVQVAVKVDETLEPGVRYRAEISIPELSETRIPLVVRRRPTALPRAPLHRNGRTAGRPRGQAKAKTPDS